MTPFQAAVLGLVQGLTEFLPISSTAHLVVVQNWFGLTEPPVTFDIVIHLGTALATVLVLWPVIKKVSLQLIKLMMFATIPTLILGLWLNQWDTLIFGSLMFTAVTLIINGLILLLPNWFKVKRQTLNNQSAGFIGIAQGLAVLPGISRSGSTIVTGLLFGLKPEEAYNFSFLISLPAILGAQALHLNDINIVQSEFLNFGLGFVTALISGYFALLWLRRLVSRGRLNGFAIYCLVLGTLLLIL